MYQMFFINDKMVWVWQLPDKYKLSHSYHSLYLEQQNWQNQSDLVKSAFYIIYRQNKSLTYSEEILPPCLREWILGVYTTFLCI